MDKAELLEKVSEQIKNCRKCELWKTRNKPVPGEGNPNSKIMLIGLGPGKQEDLEGRPFVGPAGKFLDELIGIVGLRRQQVFITNVMKCFLPDNQATEHQIELCTPYLDKQIEIIKPKLIVTLGNIATNYILKKFGLSVQPISKIHGEVFEVNTLIGKIKIIPMYHPASALYNPGMRQILIEDWESIQQFLR